MGAVLAMKLAVLALAVLALTGCQPVMQRLSGNPGGERASLPAAALAGPVLEVRIPSRGAVATLARAGVNRDVETWLTADNISISFRQGVLVASRGLGFDLMGADADGTLTALAGGGPPVYRRHMRFLTGEHRSTWLMAGCSLQETTSDQPGLRRIEERCKAHRHRIANLFWLDGAGTIRRSRQWVAPEIGYIETRWQTR